MNNNIKKLLDLFHLRETVYKLSNKRIAERNKVSLDEVYQAKKLFKEEKHKALLEHCKETGVDFNDVKFYWHKSKKFSMNVIPDREKNLTDELLESFDNIIENYQTKGIKTFTPIVTTQEKALKVTISDDHVGLEPNPKLNGGLFMYEYNGEIYKESIQKVYSSIIKEYNTHGTFELLLLDNLGDQEDGWDQLTTRGGHKLPQNMSNGEVFEVCVDSKVSLIESLVESKVANKIILRTVTNSNHSNEFALIVNKAIEKIINRLYSTKIVEVETLTKFIEHRTWGDHTWLLCHGKDSQHMFKGLPLILNDKTVNYVNEYIDFYNVNSKYIHFEKGDLHQLGYQKVKRFDYRNFMSFAPPSAWQQHNFGDSYAGYSIQVIPKYSNEISHTDYFLDYSKKR